VPAQDGLGDAQLDRRDVGGGEPLRAQPQGGVHARVGEVVARVRLEDHARQLRVRAQAADDGVRVGAVAAECLQKPEAALQHGRRAGEPVPARSAAATPQCAAQPQWTRLTVPPVRLASLQQAGAHAGRDAGGAGDPRLVLPLQHRHGHRGADRAADGRRVQTTLAEHSSNDPTNQRVVISTSRDTPIHRS
jgi:hypothetical protein